MKTPPVGFVRSLKSFNKDLRVRWSFEKRKWIIEHAVSDRRALFTPVHMQMTADGKVIEHRLPALSDRAIQWRDMCYGILYVEKLDSRVIPILASMDTSHHKSAKAFAKHVEDREAKAEAYTDRKKHEALADYSSDVYSYLKNRDDRAFPNGTAR